VNQAEEARLGWEYGFLWYEYNFALELKPKIQIKEEKYGAFLSGGYL